MKTTVKISLLPSLFFVLAGIVFALTTFAQTSSKLPTGSFSGFVSNNPFEEWCQVNRAELEFVANKDGSTNLNWQETGISRGRFGGFCDNVFDAVLTPTSKPGEWDVDFNWNFDLNFGKARLNNGVLVITATFSGSRNSFQSFRTELTISPDQSQISYSRRIDRWGPTLFANGELYAD